MLFNSRQICRQKRNLPVRPSIRAAPEQDDRWLAFRRQCQNGSEIRVSRDQYTILFYCSSKNPVVLSGLQSVVTHMGSVVAESAQSLGHTRRKRVVD